MSSGNPLVSICIPVFNAEKTIRETLESLLRQTYPNIIIRLSDNASTDRTVGIIKEIRDPRIELYLNKENIGGEANFTRCIELGTSAYTALFHADDVYEPEMIRRQVAVLERYPDVGAVFTEATKIDEMGNTVGALKRSSYLGGDTIVFGFREIFRAILRDSNFLICPSAMLRTEIYQREIKRYRADLFNSSADLDVWLRVAERHKVAMLGEQLMRYRVSATQGSHQLCRLRTERADFFKVMDYYLAKPDVREWICRYDLKRYEWLQRTDRVVRAVNLLAACDNSAARDLCEDIWSIDALEAAVSTRRGLQTLLAGSFLRLMSAVGQQQMAGRVMQRIRRFVS